MVADRRPREFDGVHAPGKGGEQRFGLEPGHVLADALVDTHAEADVAGGV